MQRTGIRPKIGSPAVETDVPLGTFTSGQLLRYNGTTGEIDTVAGGGGGTGDVVGPASAVNNDIAVFDTTTGKLIKDGGTTIAALQAATAAKGDFSGPASSSSGTLVQFANTTGKLGSDSGIVATRVVTGPVSSTVGNVPQFNNTSGNVVADGGKLVADLVTGPASAVNQHIATFNGTSGKIIQGGVSVLLIPQATRFTQTGAGTAITSANMSDTLLTVNIGAGDYIIEFCVHTVNSVTPRTVSVGFASSVAPTSFALQVTNWLSNSTNAIGMATAVTTVGAAPTSTTAVASGSKVGTASLPAFGIGQISIASTTTVRVLATVNTSSITPQPGSYLMMTKL